MGTVRWENPRLGAAASPSSIAPAPHSGRAHFRRTEPGCDPVPSARSWSSSPRSIQSFLLEGGPTLAAAFLEHDLVDRCSSSSHRSWPVRSRGCSRGSAPVALAVRSAAGGGRRRDSGLHPRAVSSATVPTCSPESCGARKSRLGRWRKPRRSFVVEAPDTAAGLLVGDSISVNGCCLTAASIEGGACLGACGSGDADALDARAFPLRRKRSGERQPGH